MTNPTPALLALRSRMLAANALAGLGGDMPARLSIADNRFTLFDAAGNEKIVGELDNKVGLFLDVNFIDMNEHVSKRYRPTEEKFDPANPTPPTCFSDDGIAPDDASTMKQASACVSCRHNERGSAISKISGAKIKACQDTKKAAIIVPATGDIVYQFVVTPGSMDAWRQYLKTLAGHKMPDGSPIDLILVTTRIYFAGQGVLGFQPVALIDEPTAERIERLLNAKASDFAVGRSNKPATLAPPAPVQQVVHQEPIMTGVTKTAPGTMQFNYEPPQAGPFSVASVAPDAPKPRGRPRNNAAPPPVRANETLVGAGPIPPNIPWPETATTSFPSNGGGPSFGNSFAGPPQPAQRPFAPADAQPAFGIQPNPLPPTADMQAALDNVFNLPT